MSLGISSVCFYIISERKSSIGSVSFRLVARSCLSIYFCFLIYFDYIKYVSICKFVSMKWKSYWGCISNSVRGWDSLLSEVTGYRLDDRFNSQWVCIFYFYACKLCNGYWVLFSLCESFQNMFNHSLSFSVKVNNVWSFSLYLMYTFMVCLVTVTAVPDFYRTAFLSVRCFEAVWRLMIESFPWFSSIPSCTYHDSTAS